MSFFESLIAETRNSAANLAELARGGKNLRLGVTGLSRAGKTVFITALARQLTLLGKTEKNALPAFRVAEEGRIVGGRLEPQPDDHVPRFAYEDHLAALTGPERHWPQSTRQISQLRLRLDFERREGFFAGPAALTIDIVDYPGEWLLDLPLLDKTYATWSRETFEASASAARAPFAAEWRGFALTLAPAGPEDEGVARKAAEKFTAYLRAARGDAYALSTLPPGRFLMPGDLEGSPALTFAPLPLPDDFIAEPGTLAAMMERRYEAYKAHVVKPFFRDHFARLDRQIVLVDALSALNSGPEAMRDLQRGLNEVLAAFRVGRNNVLNTLFRPRIDKILVAATKADHLHHLSHDRLEAILRVLTERAIARSQVSAPRSMSSRSPPCAPPGRPPCVRGATRSTPLSARPWPAKPSMARALTARPKQPFSQDNCRSTPSRFFAATRWRARSMRLIIASCASARLWSARMRRRRRSGSTAPANSCSETG